MSHNSNFLFFPSIKIATQIYRKNFFILISYLHTKECSNYKVLKFNNDFVDIYRYLKNSTICKFIDNKFQSLSLYFANQQFLNSKHKKIFQENLLFKTKFLAIKFTTVTDHNR